MTDVNKAIKPVESLTFAPLNEGSDFKANNFILFRIGASNMNMWLTNNSYLTFDLECSESGDLYATSQVTKACPTYIKNACNLFSSIEVLYGGDTIYSQPYNIEQNTLKQLYYGENYLKTNYASFTTREMILADKADSTNLNEGINAYLKLNNNSKGSSADDLKIRAATVIRNVMVPINQLIPLFMDMGAEGFPVRCLKNQIEIRLYIAEPYRYLVDWNPVQKDFSNNETGFYLYDASGESTFSGNQAKTLKDRYKNENIKLTNVKMFCQHYLPDAALAARIDNEALNSQEGMNWQFTRTEIALRQVGKIGTTNNLPFSASTENTNSLMFFCHNTSLSPGVMFRPKINSLYIKFGSNQLPFQPIQGTTYDAPFEYKFTSDDVLNNLDTYFSETNHDYASSYKFIDRDTSMDAKKSVPESSFLLMGANYCADPSSLGSQSSQWQSQYQATFNAPNELTKTLTFVLGVESKWGMTLQQGKLMTLNI